MRAFKVPEEALASIIGQEGRNLKDIVTQTGAKINTKRKLNNCLASIFINGGDEILAESLIVVSVKHYFASIVPLKRLSNVSSVSEEEIVSFDVRCFISEIRRNKV